MIACAAISIEDAPNGKAASKLKTEFQMRIETTPIATLAETKYRDRDLRSSLSVPKRIGANSYCTPKRPTIVPHESNTKGASITPQSRSSRPDSRVPVPRKYVVKLRIARIKNPARTMSRLVR